MTSRAAATGRRWVRLAAALAAWLGAAACVTTVEDAPLSLTQESAVPRVPVVVPIEGGEQGNRVLWDVYGGVFDRLRQAAEERDEATVEALLQTFDKPDLPPAIRERLRGYRGLARGISFLRHAAERSELLVVTVDGKPAAGPPDLGSALRLELRLPAPPQPVRLGGTGDPDPIGFAVSVTLDDEFVDGGVRSSHAEEFVWLPKAIRLAGDVVLTVPLELDPAAGDAVRRTAYVRVDLLPGYVDVDSVRAPVQRHAIAAGSFVQFPRGYERIAAAPLETLRQALAAFAPPTFPVVYLSAIAMPPADREAAMALLVEQVRFGSPEQAQVAMAALRRLAGISLPVGDRDAWLAWWQGRR